ncbi:MAG: hydroxyacylglutathione hydrolase [Burkholderiales bacterium]|nr:hydroxyacylglutathione hydrolase [Burkholderiales bacterium]MDE2564732.1 hydroxyacylglutathione hydrolase [Burkholderiales bacterium]
MNLIALPAFADNYIWMLHDGARAVVVDPGDAAPVLAALDQQRLTLAGILVTHHHADHVGGVTALHPRLQGPVWGPARERIPQPCVPLAEGDRIEVLGLPFEVLDVPGHTAGHIAYVQAGPGDDDAAPLLFCGDTLFSAGCGRLFEGTPAQMQQSLAKLAALPGRTRVCCTHEYTLSNLRFAAAVEPANARRAEHEARCRALREAGRPTLPSTVSLEREINPFLRCAEPAVVAAARAQGAAGDDEVSVLAALREWKNRFR